MFGYLDIHLYAHESYAIFLKYFILAFTWLINFIMTLRIVNDY